MKKIAVLVGTKIREYKGLLKKYTRDTMIHGLLENPKESYKEMPDGFVEFVWSAQLGHITKLRNKSNTGGGGGGVVEG